MDNNRVYPPPSRPPLLPRAVQSFKPPGVVRDLEGAEVGERPQVSASHRLALVGEPEDSIVRKLLEPPFVPEPFPTLLVLARDRLPTPVRRQTPLEKCHLYGLAFMQRECIKTQQKHMLT